LGTGGILGVPWDPPVELTVQDVEVWGDSGMVVDSLLCGLRTRPTLFGQRDFASSSP
jgi:hypothetical protein